MKIYIFYKYDGTGRIIVSAPSFFEASGAICEMYDNASLIYNFKEYKLENIINRQKFFSLLNITPDYVDFVYILTENQYKEIKDLEIVKDINECQSTKNVIDKSCIDNKYNVTLLNENDTFELCIDRINKKNGISKEEIDNKLKKEDEQKINLIKDQISNILYSYVGQLNNSKLRNNIKKDITNFYNKYFKETSSNVIKLNVEQLKKMNALQDEIKKIREEIKNEANPEIIQEAREKIKDLNEKIKNITK